MRQNTSDIDQLPVISNSRNQTVFISRDIEDRQGSASPGFDAIGMRIDTADLPQASPISRQGGPEPLTKRCFSVGMPIPECFERFLADHSHP
jgi:hypothetical protein